jgi:hypothetical protein
MARTDSHRHVAIAARIGEMRAAHSRKPSFVRRLDKAGLTAANGEGPA